MIVSRAFPTGYVSYASGYSWGGTLSTNGVCSTVTGAVFVTYGSSYSWSGPTHITTMPPSSLFSNGADPGGLLWTIAYSIDGYGPAPTKYGAASCNASASQGEGVLATAQIVFNTMIVTGGSGNSLSSYTPPSTVTATQTAASTGDSSSAAAPTQTATSLASWNHPQRIWSIRIWAGIVAISTICIDIM